MIRYDLATMPPDLAVAALRDQKRANKAAVISASDVRPALDIDQKPIDGMFEVRSQSKSNEWYDVDLRGNAGKGSCTCMDWTNRAQECKHIKAAKLYDQPKATPESVIKLVEKARGDCVFSEERCGPNNQGKTCMNYAFCKADFKRRQQ